MQTSNLHFIPGLWFCGRANGGCRESVATDGPPNLG
jgi:hypothetical protein